MMADIESEIKFTSHLIGKDKFDPRVMQAISKTPRDKFVPEHLKHRAHDNGPLPIGHEQTISQPYIVALMTELLALNKNDVVLEIGTGSGYQTAILSQLCNKVFTIERIEPLALEARQRLELLGYKNIESHVGNGYLGWPEQAPYDGIIVTAAATHIPDTLTEQLKPGGRLVIPIGLPNMHQELMLLKKDLNDKIQTTNVLGVAFVPLRDDPYLSNTNNTHH